MSAIPAAVLTGAAVAGTGLVGYSTYQNYKAYNNGNISKDQFDYNSGSLLGGLLAPAKLGKIGSTTAPKLTGIRANKAAGDAFESEQLGILKKEYPNIQSQVTIQAQSGTKTRIDFIAKDAKGNFCLFECKSSSTASFTKNQSQAFPQIFQTGGIVLGQGKPGFPGGTLIPPAKINILRPNK